MKQNGASVFNSVSECVEAIIEEIGNEILLGLPIGVGKPTILANEFYRQAKQNPGLSLKLISGLTLATPGFSSDIERRFMEPLVKRIFKDYPDPVYLEDAKNKTLPPNIELIEFFLTPGAHIGNKALQQNYISSNYTHVPRDVNDMGLNIAASMVGKNINEGQPVYSLGSNADAPLDMIRLMNKEKEKGRRVAVVGQVNSNMPFMYGAAELEQDEFDFIIDSPDFYHTLFGPPREPVTTTDFFIGLHSSTLVRDGGTLQIGIGSLGDAIACALQLRHTSSDTYIEVLDTIGSERFKKDIDSVGGTQPFKTGLYGCTELLTDGFLQLISSGVIKRSVYDDLRIQKPLIEGKLKEDITTETLDALIEEGAISTSLTREEFRFLKEFGVFKSDVEFDGTMIIKDNEKIRADLEDGAARDEIARKCLGERLNKGILIHSSFFLGPQSFYQTLRDMDEAERRKISMREISFCNQLYGEENLKSVQRKEGRFYNTAIMMTALGAAVSDGLENGQVISGVGGQYNFVSMGHALPDGRSVILVRATKERGGRLLSGVVWNYGHITIPRHLRDIFVTEYGIANVRGKTDQETIKAILNVTDSRFQESLLKKAKDAGKLPREYRIPGQFSNNYPERLEKELEKFRANGLFQPFPYGTELTEEEIVLGKALKTVKERMSSLKSFRMPSFSQMGRMISIPPAAKPYLERMKLDKPSSSKEIFMQKLVLYGLSITGVI